MTMRLKNLQISRGWSGDKELTGKIQFSTDDGDISIKLKDEDVRQILEYCAEAIVVATKRVAECMTKEALSTNLIEHSEEQT